MSKEIDNLMRISDQGYVDDYGDIEEILEHFLNYTVADFAIGVSKDRVKIYANEVVRILGNIRLANNGCDYVDTLKISDLLGIMQYFENNYDAPAYVLWSYMKNLRNFVKDAKKLPWVRLFLATTLKSLMYYLNAKFNAADYSGIYQTASRLSPKYAGFEIHDLTKIGEILEDIHAGIHESWTPGYDVDDYTNQIKKCCHIVQMIFVNGIADAYLKSFDINAFAAKIGGIAVSFDDLDECETDKDSEINL